MAKGGHSHRSTLKNDHKPFKSKHASKGQLKNQHKGKVEKASTGTHKAVRVLSKAERKNTERQLKEKKILETRGSRRLFEGSQGAEKIVTVVALTSDLDGAGILAQLVNGTKEHADDPDVVFAQPAVHAMRLPRFKSNVRFILPDPRNLMAVLDAAKVSDYVVFGLSAQQEVEKAYGEQILRAVVAQGVASVVGVVPNLVSAYPKKNLQQDVRQSLQLYFCHFFPAEERLYALDSAGECANCIRALAQRFPKPVNWRDARGYLLADRAEWHPNGDSGLVVVEGTARGVGFNADRLVHLAGHGDFQLERIEKVARHQNAVAAAFAPSAAQDDLLELSPAEADMDELCGGVDGFDGPDGFDGSGARGVAMEGKHYFGAGDAGAARASKVPRGTSEYQSKWLLDDVLEGASDVEELEPEERMETDAGAGEDGPAEADAEMYVELSAQEEEEQLRQFRALARAELEFPDEVEMAPHEAARERLRDYRGIKSLGTCSWDWDERDAQRPPEYGRMLRITNFKATRNRLHKNAVREAQVVGGERVRLVIRAPRLVLDGVDVLRLPFVVYLLLEHEHKLAVANFSFQTWEDHEDPVPSGDRLVVQYGFRRQVISPMFNQASNNANNVHKFERFAQPGDLCIATAIAPPLFYNAPALFFRERHGAVEMVGQGTFLNCDHKRVAAERVVLTGHPVKIHKRLVTVRYMFFNPDDINWFKAVPLFTKSGRTGFIKESLGTHGYFKCTFDGKLSAQDVVAMALYRRVWPAPSQLWA